MKIVAIKDMSAGNAEVGEMWQETKIFDGSTPVEEILAWAETPRKKVTLTVPDGEVFPKPKPEPDEELPF